jgi:opacity protein-like surface antigen
MRWNITRAWGVFLTNTYGYKYSVSQFFSARNFEIESITTQPKLSYQPTTAFRISLIYQYSHKQNVIEGGFQKAVLNDIGAEFKLNKLSKGSLTIKADFINITYNDDQTTPVAYDMLNSLHVGNNLTWNASFQQNVSGNMQISITYEGRKTPDYKLVNIGGATVRAFF